MNRSHGIDQPTKSRGPTPVMRSPWTRLPRRGGNGQALSASVERKHPVESHHWFIYRCEGTMSRQIVGYVRVSTARQSRSGLGLEAQRVALARFAEVEGFAYRRRVHRGRDRQGVRCSRTASATRRGARQGEAAQMSNPRRQAGPAEPRRCLHLWPHVEARPVHRCRVGHRCRSVHAPLVRRACEEGTELIAQRTR